MQQLLKTRRFGKYGSRSIFSVRQQCLIAADMNSKETIHLETA
jgi:hypothetical protein